MSKLPWVRSFAMSDDFDVFLCHSSTDQIAVRDLADELELRELKVWLAELELIPGRPWQEEFEAAIQGARSVAVLVGRDGQGPWQEIETRAALTLGVKQGKPVIPVLLPGAAAKPDLPLFLQAYTWVDFRSGVDVPGLDRLEWGIRGKKPGRPLAAPETNADPPLTVPVVTTAGKKTLPSPFWQKNKESLERWALLLGVLTLVLGVPGILLELPGKWAAFWESSGSDLQRPVPMPQLLRGEFRDATTDQALPGVRVWLPELRLEASTDGYGQFKVELDLPENKHVKLRATLDGYEPVNEDPSVGTFLNVWKMKRLP